VRQSKENLRHEIEQLRRHQHSSEQVLSALVRPQLWEEVLSRLRSGQGVEIISDWLEGSTPGGPAHVQKLGRPPGPGGNVPAVAGFTGAATGTYAAVAPGSGAANLGHHPQGPRHDADQPSPWSGHLSTQSQTVSTRSDSHPEIMSWGPETIRGPPQSRVGSWVESQDGSPEGQRYQVQEQILHSDIPEMQVSPNTWTTITGDARLVKHLLSLYFCWEYPTFASLSKEHFLRDFQDGRARYCSSILLNALLALGCRFSSQPSTRANPDDPYTSGDHFFTESLRLFHQEENHHNLTTIQALGIMSIREASCGRDSESWYYAGQSIRLAIEMGLHRLHDDGSDDESAVQAATFWGAFALDQYVTTDPVTRDGLFARNGTHPPFADS
jgi:hypothetical protein